MTEHSPFGSPFAAPTDQADQAEAPVVSSEQGEAVASTPDALAASTEAGTAAADLAELGAGGVEDAPSGYLADAAPDGVGLPDADGAEDGVAAPEDAFDESDPAEVLRRELVGQQGDWYVVHSYAGYENKVKTNLESRIQSLNMEDYIYAIEVPQEEVTEVKGGKRQQVVRKKLPGYLFVRMDLTDESWSAVRNTPGVTGFVGQTSKPTPLTVDEVVRMIAPPKQKVVVAQKAVDFEVGESITVTDGPFATL
ncbi:MAG: NusG antitermination factor, partial [Frankiales bacterium]|nr:NusG antitermination factor [Frankiales bacterium]